MSARFELHGLTRSAPTNAVALMLRLSGEKFDYTHVNLMGGEHKTPEYLAKNRFGVVPALIDHKDGQVYVQSASIIEHISEATRKFRGRNKEARKEAREWMFWCWDKLAPNIYRSRGMRLGIRQFSFDTASLYYTEGCAGLKQLDDHLAGRKWIVGNSATFADIQIYGVVSFASAGGFLLADYKNIGKWIKRIEKLPNFQPTQGSLPAANAKGI